MTATNTTPTRRHVLKLLGATTAALAAAPVVRLRAADAVTPLALKGHIKQGFTPGVLPLKNFEDVCRTAAQLGIQGLDFVKPADWPTLKKYGLVCSMTRCEGSSIPNGFNRKENHAKLLADLRQAIEVTAAAGFPNVICLSGNRAGLADEAGLVTCAEGLKQLVGYAEEKKVTLCMELLNSKRMHKDYQCDRTTWGVELCRRVGSERFKLLYDIFHMQTQEGDIIATIREHIKYLAHFHTAGVPGRNEIDDTQELFYPAIMRAIAATGFTGFVSHEYRPTRDPAASLAQSVRICDV